MKKIYLLSLLLLLLCSVSTATDYIYQNCTGGNVSVYINGTEYTASCGSTSNIPFYINGTNGIAGITSYYYNGAYGSESMAFFNNTGSAFSTAMQGFFPFGDAEDTYDMVFNGNPAGIAGKIGHAIDFESGDSDWIQIGDIDLSKGTLSAWTKIESNVNDGTIIEKRAGSGNDYDVNYMIRTTSGPGIRYTVGTDTAYYCDATYSADLSGAWHLIQMTFNSSGCYLYVNGTLVSSDTTVSGTIYQHDSQAVIGKYVQAPTYFDGIIDDVRIYNDELDATERACIYNGGSGNQNENCSSDSMVFHSTMESLGDSTSNNNDLTTGGNPTLTTGYFGTAFDLDGDNDYFDIGSLSLNGYTELTICAWVECDDTSGNRGILEDSKSGDGTTSLRVLNNKAYFKMSYSGGEFGTITGSTNVGTGWRHICGVYNGSHSLIYLNGSSDASPVAGSQTITSDGSARIGCYDGSCSTDFDGIIDEVQIWNKGLTADEIMAIYNDSAWVISPTGILIEIISPPNASSFNTSELIVQFNITNAVLENSNCSLYLNNTLNQTLTNLTSPNTTQFNVSGIADGEYTFKVGCKSTSVSETNTTTRTIWVDTVTPQIINNNPLFINGSRHWKNITLDFIINDTNNYESIINVTSANGTNIFSQLYNMSSTTLFNITNTINHTFTSWYTFVLTAYDGHTAKQIEEIPNKINNKEIIFTEKQEEVKIYPANKNMFTTATTIKKEVDRYNFEFKRNLGFTKVEGYDDFYVEGGYFISIVKDSKYPGHIIVKKGTTPYDWYWIDFNTDQKYRVDVFRVRDNKVRIRVYGDNKKDYSFNSLGRLNVNNVTIHYYFDARNINLTTSYTENIISGFSTTFTLNATYNPVKYNTSLETPSAYVTWNGTNYTATLISLNTTHARFTRSITPSYSGIYTNITHNWTFQIKNQTNNTINTTTTNSNQTLYNINIGQCNDTLNYSVVNFTYFDENTMTAIYATNDYQLTFYDGTYNWSVSGQFEYDLNSGLCTNLPSPELNYTWLMYGTLTISNSSYLTRVYTFGQADGYTIGNYYNTTIPFYLLTSSNSSTVTYTWQTTSYQLINGIMKIYKCNPNGTKSLIESINIISGTAVANIELLFQQYSYEVIIDGTTYTDTDSYTACHVESSTTPIYYVNIDSVDITPAIGLLLVNCDITLSGQNVTMTFEDIGGDSPLTGCLDIKRKDIYGYTLTSTVCTNLTGSGTATTNYTFVDDGNIYVAVGYIYSGEDLGFCDGTAVYPTSTSTTEDQFGVSGIFSIALLILSMGLIYSTEGSKMLFAGIIGLILAWVLGIFNMSWEIISLIVFFFGIIAMVGRYSRKGG